MLDKVIIKLASIECTATGEAIKNGDDLYIKYSVDGTGISQRHPDGNGSGYDNIKAGESWNIDLNISYKERVRIDLYDNDTTDSNDYLGGYEYTREDASKTLTIDTGSSQNGKYNFHTKPAQD